MINYFKRRINNLSIIIKEKIRYRHFQKKASILYDAFMDGGGTNIIIFSSDCVGGRLMNDFRMPVNTPMVNNWYTAEDFLKICENPQKYFSEPIEMLGTEGKGTCVGRIDDVIVHFGHEFDQDIAAKKWKRGCKQFFRAIKKNFEVVVIMTDRNGFEDNDVSRFESLPYTYKVLYTHKKYPSAPHTFYMKGEDKLPYVQTITDFENLFSIKRRYDRYDFFNLFMEIYSMK